MIENNYITMIGKRCLPDENGYETNQTRFCNTEPCTGKYFLKHENII